MSEISEKIIEGFKLASKKMLEEMALKNQEIVVSDGNGKPIRVNARTYFTEEELKKILNIEIVNNKIVNLPAI